jgi:3-hydroxyisobutyrate dehydrogenase
MNIGFIGLGNMGNPMAHNLIKAGHQLVIFDISAEAVERFEGLPVTPLNSPKAVASENVELIMTMLPSSPHVKSVYYGDQGVLAGVRQGILIIDCSTIDPFTAREVAAAAKKKGNPMLDAPVSGGTGGAAAGTLTFMVGGNTADFEKSRPILAAMGKNIVYCGESGNGQAAKLANNLLLAISMIGVVEAMSLGAKLGLDPKVLAEIINSSSGRCWSSDTYNPYPGVMENVPAARGYTGGFGSDLMLKDLGLATDAAKSAKQPVILGAVAQQLYQTFSNQGHGHLDFSAIIELYNTRCNRM